MGELELMSFSEKGPNFTILNWGESRDRCEALREIRTTRILPETPPPESNCRMFFFILCTCHTASSHFKCQQVVRIDLKSSIRLVFLPATFGCAQIRASL